MLRPLQWLGRRMIVSFVRRRRLCHREVCKRCGRENPLGFAVSDEVWQAAVPERYRNRVLCILCFDELATARGVDWARHPIRFYPVSGMVAKAERA